MNNQSAILTPNMRQWLGRRWLDMPLLYDVIAQFREEFDLDVEQAALAVAQWIRETQ